MNSDFTYAEDSAAAPPCMPGHKHHFHQMAAGGEAHFNLNTPFMCCNCWATLGMDKEGIGHFPAENARRAAAEGAAGLVDITDHLRAERDALRAELATIKAQAEDATEYVLALENKRLRAEIEALRKDAERYRWLRDIAPWKSPLAVTWAPLPDDTVYLLQGQLDAAIDAVRKGEKP